MDQKDRLNRIKSVSTVVEPSVKEEAPAKKAKPTNEQMESVLKLADEFEKRIEENSKAEVKEPEKLILEDETDDTYFYDQMGSRRPNAYSNRRRREIEKRLKPIEIEKVVFLRRVEQIIPIIPNKLEITLRETTGKEDRFIKDLIAKLNMQKDELSTASVAARMALYQITFSLLEVNGKPLRDVSIKKDPPGEEELKAFNEKLDWISEYPDDFLEELNIQLQWFKDRVKRVTMEDITNFSKAP